MMLSDADFEFELSHKDRERRAKAMKACLLHLQDLIAAYSEEPEPAEPPKCPQKAAPATIRS